MKNYKLNRPGKAGMKRTFCALALAVYFLFIAGAASAQGMAVNNTGALANGSAILDVSSTTKGVLVPRMTTAQRNAITSPATGLMIFQTDGTPGFYYYTGTVWSAVGGSSLPTGSAGDILYNNGTTWGPLGAGSNGQVLTIVGGVPTWSAPLLVVGMPFGGGVVAYILKIGDPGYSSSVQHGLIAATSDQALTIQWYNGSYITIGVTGTALGTGSANTAAIIASQGAGSYAATLCTSYTGGGYTDWYLPSRNELIQIYSNKSIIGNFVGSVYWSSSEGSSFDAITLNFIANSLSAADKGFANSVRAVRSF